MVWMCEQSVNKYAKIIPSVNADVDMNEIVGLGTSHFHHAWLISEDTFFREHDAWLRSEETISKKRLF